MHQFTIAAVVAIVALISAAPASADYLGGGPRKQNGQCWKGSKGSEGFGSWRACPAALVNGRDKNGRKKGDPGFIDPDARGGGGAYSGG